jgi:hypothetical protein
LPNTSYTQQALAYDQNFHLRVRAALATVAWQVLNEATDTPGHVERETYARQVVNNLTAAAQTVAPWLVERPNLMAFDTTYNFPAGHVVTASGDADIESQLMSDWNVLANVPDPEAPETARAPGLPR